MLELRRSHQLLSHDHEFIIRRTRRREHFLEYTDTTTVLRARPVSRRGPSAGILEEHPCQFLQPSATVKLLIFHLAQNTIFLTSDTASRQRSGAPESWSSNINIVKVFLFLVKKFGANICRFRTINQLDMEEDRRYVQTFLLVIGFLM